MRSTTIFHERNRRIIESVKTLENDSLLSHAYNASLYLSFREDLFIFGYILQALEEGSEGVIRRENINNLMAAIHLLLLSGYHTYNLPMYYNRDFDSVTNRDTLHKYCNESIAELIIIILSRKSISRLLKCSDVNSRSLLRLVRLFTECKDYNHQELEGEVNNYLKLEDEGLKEEKREEMFSRIIKEEMYRVFRVSFIGYEVLRYNVFPSRDKLDNIDELSKRFSELYILTYTDFHPPCNSVESCTKSEEMFMESKRCTIEVLLKCNYYNRSFGNILQFIERGFLCKIRDSMRKHTQILI